MRHPTASLSIGLSVGLAIGLSVAAFFALPGGRAESSEPDKTLKLYFGHTGETGTFTFKRNGVYDQATLNKINVFLRDWRKDQPTHMDPHLLDLVWAIYQKSGSHDAIHVVSAFRSPATNEMLRSRAGSGVAKNSQHRLGKAMDWYLTDVPLAKLRGIAMQMQGGGVGYYPRSGSPFVHTDTGNVRAWPRMTRQQLLALFPNGNTLHLPSSGPPLPGYELALAKRQAQGGGTALAYLDTGASEGDDTDRTGTGSSSSWLKRVFTGNKQDVAAATPAPAPVAADDAPQMVAASDDDESDADMPRQPRARPGSAAADETVVASVDATSDASPVPLPRSRPDEGENSGAASVDGQDAIASLTERMNQESPISATRAADPVALAFAAASDAPQPSKADRAILTAFAALKESTAVRTADPALTAALTRLGSGAKQPVKLAVAYVGDAVLRSGDAEAPATAAAVTQPAVSPRAEPGVVLASVESPSYLGDEHNLVDLIDTSTETPATTAGEFAMPKPASGLLVAPEGASEVADLRGQAGPPVDHFARNTGQTPEQQGFLSRLFASLVE